MHICSLVFTIHMFLTLNFSAIFMPQMSMPRDCFPVCLIPNRNYFNGLYAKTLILAGCFGVPKEDDSDMELWR